MKRCGKSAPREAQATRHGKPHRVQGQIGNRGVARSVFRESETGFGYRSLRQMILSVRKNADRIRLTALPKPIFSSKGRVPRVPLFIFCKNELVELVPPAISFSSRSGWHPAAKIFSAIKPQVHLNCPAGPRRGGKSHRDLNCIECG